MWWILQILYIIGIVIIQVFNSYAGSASCPYVFSLTNKILINAGWLSITAPLAIISYAKAPSFFQPWFLGTVLIAVLGFVASFLFFGEPLLAKRMAGAVLSIIAAVLLII